MKITVDGIDARCNDGHSIMGTSEFIKNLVAVQGPNIDYIIPDGVRYIRHTASYIHYAIEIEPQLHCLTVSGSKGTGSGYVAPATYRIAMPWIVILGVLGRYEGRLYCQQGFNECYFMTSRMEDPLDQPLFAPALLNCHWHNDRAVVSMCLGHLEVSSSISGAIMVVRRAFFNKKSNYSIGDPVHDIYSRTPIGDMREWEKMSLANPHFVLKFPWRKMRFNLAERCAVRESEIGFSRLTKTVFDYGKRKR